MNERNQHLGKKAKDTVTGFKGTITGVVQYLTGCDQYLITAKCKSATGTAESGWFDENRVKVNDKKPMLRLELGPGLNDNGPDIEAPIK